MNILTLIFILCFVSLILFSVTTWFVSFGKKIGVWLLGARVVPILCAFMPVLLIAEFATFSFVFQCYREYGIGRFFAFVLLIFPPLLGLIIFVVLAGRRYINQMLSIFVFGVYFMGCAMFSVGVFSGGFALVVNGILPWSFTWQRAEISSEPVCSIEFKRIHFTAEYDRRVKFASGKTVGITCDTGGAGGFIIYQIPNGKFLAVPERNLLGLHSFIIDPKNETVHIVLDNEAYKLNGDFISGYGGSVLYTYKKNLNEQSSFRAIAERVPTLEPKERLGVASAIGFNTR